MLPLDQLTQSISIYPKDHLIQMVADQCWSVFLDKELGLEQTRRGRHFATCASWICFIAAGSDVEGKFNKSIAREILFKLSHKTWKFLSHESNALSLEEKRLKCEEFIPLYKSALEQFLSENPKSRLRHLQLYCNITHTTPEWFKIYQNVQYSEDHRRRNFEFDIKYSHVPVIRSLLIWQHLEVKQLSERKASQNLEICGLSALRFHQILLMV